MLNANLKTFLDEADKLPVLPESDSETISKNVKEYTQGLFDNGGVSTDVFKGSIGVEKTKDFYENVMFKSGK